MREGQDPSPVASGTPAEMRSMAPKYIKGHQRGRDPPWRRSKRRARCPCCSRPDATPRPFSRPRPRPRTALPVRAYCSHLTRA